MADRRVEGDNTRMARARTGGRTLVGGRRRPCRRLLPALLALGVLVPQPVTATSSADAWMSAQHLHSTRSTAIGRVAEDLSDGGGAREIRMLRAMIGSAVAALDALEVHDCFRVWWSYVRTSYVMLDVALMGMMVGDMAGAQRATTTSAFLSRMAEMTPVDCPRDGSVLPRSTEPRHGDDRPIVMRPGVGVR